MIVKQTTFRDVVKMNGFRKIYPKTALDNQPHITFEDGDVVTVGEVVTGDYEFRKFHYTCNDPNSGKIHIGFTENGGRWECDKKGFIPPPLRAAVEDAKKLAKQFVTALGGTCSW